MCTPLTPIIMPLPAALVASAPAIVGALSSLVGSALSNKYASDAQERSITAQRGLQNMLINGGAQMARTAKQAGLSPAFALGSASTPTAPAVASNFSPVDTSGFQSLLGGYAQRRLQRMQEKEVKANSEIAEEKAKQERIITAKMQGESNAFNEPTNYVDENGVTVVGSSSNVILGAAEQGYQQGLLKKAEMDLQKKGFDVQSIEYDIKEGVFNQQKENPQILSAMAQLPVEQLNQIKAHAKELFAAARAHDASALESQARKAYIDVQKTFEELRKNEYASGSVDNLFKNFSLENFFKWFLRNLLDVVNIGVKIK